MTDEINAEYRRRVWALAQLVSCADGDLELIGHYHAKHARWCEAVAAESRRDKKIEHILKRKGD